MSRHTVTAEIEVNFTPAGLTETETAYPEIEITFSYSPGTPEQGPTFDCGGQPAEGPEIELVSAKLIDGHGIEPTQEQVNDWAEEWLYSDFGYEAASKAASDY